MTGCHLARDSSGQQDMQEVRWTEHSLQDKRGACQSGRGIGPQRLPSGQPSSEAPRAALTGWSQGGWGETCPGAQAEGEEVAMSPGSPVFGGKDASLPSEPTLEGAQLPGLCPDTQDTRAEQRQPLHPPSLLAGRGGAGGRRGAAAPPPASLPCPSAEVTWAESDSPGHLRECSKPPVPACQPQTHMHTHTRTHSLSR